MEPKPLSATIGLYTSRHRPGSRKELQFATPALVRIEDLDLNHAEVRDRCRGERNEIVFSLYFQTLDDSSKSFSYYIK